MLERIKIGPSSSEVTVGKSSHSHLWDTGVNVGVCVLLKVKISQLHKAKHKKEVMDDTAGLGVESSFIFMWLRSASESDSEWWV